MKKEILKSISLHIFLAWILLNILWLGPYLYRVHLHGNYLWKEDGTATTAWDYFLLLNYYRSNVYSTISRVFIYIPLVELNYWYVIKKFTFGKAIITAFSIGAIATMTIAFPWDADLFHNSPLWPITSTFSYAAYPLVYGMVRKYFSERNSALELQIQKSVSELNALKAQLNPHFFFNSLNYLYGSALNEKADKTADAISKLADMMRYTVTGMNENFVAVNDELSFIENYLDLQRARIPEKDSIKIKSNITTAKTEYKIPPLILLPFLENAFKYGISIDHPCMINISIKVIDNQLIMSVENRIIAEHSEVKGNNTGIKNTEKRLKLLYGNEYTLKYDYTGSEYHVSLIINLT